MLCAALFQPALAQSVKPFPEFNRQNGLGAINVLPAWSKSTGAQTIVGVVDSGVRLTHEDIRPNLLNTGRDFVNGDSVANDDSFDGHGTGLAGIMAAARNDTGIVGVAYDARILPVKVADANRDRRSEHVAAGIRFAADQGTQVINLSLPGEFQSNIQKALNAATAAGSIVVMAAGNTGGGGPLFPAYTAKSAQLAGRAIAVGSASADGRISEFSNRAGSTMDFYLVAPGERILTTTNRSDSSYDRVTSGTSFASPHVAGTAALLVELFPNIAPETVVKILLETATDLGAPGVDAVYGHGLLNAGAAVSPQGDLAIPSDDGGGSGGGGAAVAALALGGALGYSLLNKSDKVEEALILDKYGRGYSIDLSKATAVRDAHYDLSGIMENLDHVRNRVDVPIMDNATVQLYHDTPTPALYGVMDEDDRRHLSSEYSDSVAFEVSGELDHKLSYTLDYNRDPRVRLGHTGGAVPEATFFSQQSLGSSYLGFAGTGNSISLSYDSGNPLDWTLGYVEMDQDRDHGLDSTAAMFKGDLAAFEKLTLGLRLGSLSEHGNLLGGSSGNAWGVDETTTLSLGLTASYEISPRSTLFGNYAVGYSRVEDLDTGILRDFSSIGSNAYGLGIVNHDIFRSHDTFGMAWSQPLRATNGEVTLDLPVRIDADNNIYRSSERIDLEPEGREQDFEVYYAADLGKRSHLGAHFLYQHEPQHNADASDAKTFLLTMSTQF